MARIFFLKFALYVCRYIFNAKLIFNSARINFLVLSLKWISKQRFLDYLISVREVFSLCRLA